MRTTEFPAVSSLIDPLVAPNGRINDFTLLADSSALRQSGDIRRAVVGKDGKTARSRGSLSAQARLCLEYLTPRFRGA